LTTVDTKETPFPRAGWSRQKLIFGNSTNFRNRIDEDTDLPISMLHHDGIPQGLPGIEAEHRSEVQ
jgi:hypothetical protein